MRSYINRVALWYKILDSLEPMVQVFGLLVSIGPVRC